MKKLLTFLTLLTLFFGVSWAEEVTYSLTPDQASTGSSATSYITTLTDFTYNNVSWKMNQWNPSTLQIKTNQSSATSEFRFYNTSAFPGKITKVVIKFSALTVSNNSGFKFLGGTSAVTNTTGGTSGTWNSSEKTITWTPSSTSNYTFFAFYQNGKVATGTNYLANADAIVVTYDTEAIQPTLFDISYGSPSNGTISGPTSAAANTQVTLLATPNPGYQLGSWNVKDGSNNIIDVIDNIFTMPASRVIVNASFTALPTYAISVTNGTANPTTAYEGQTVTLTPTIPDGQVVDWDNTTVSPSTLEINHSDYTFTMPGEAVTVNFAFKDAPVQSNFFQRITSTSDLEVGKRYLLVYEAGNAAAGTTEGTNKYLSSESVTISNNTITLSSGSEVVPYTLSGTTGAYQFADPDGKYITPTAAKSLNLDANGTVKAGITFNGNDVVINFGSTYGIMYYNASNPRFLNYTSTQTAIQLYKEVESTPQSSDVYIVGQINGHDSDPWNTSEGVQLTYNSSTDTYGVDIYCTGMKNGNDDGYSYFLFAKSLPFSWDNTSNLYGSGADGSYWPISGLPNESAFDEEIPLYENSKNVYRLPAGLYTVTVDLDYTGHEYTTKSVKVTKRDVTLNVTNSATFDDTKNVTMTSNLTELGGKIWYTTDGSDPRTQSNTNRHEYTEQISLDATTTIKAVAVLGCIYSDVVEKTYTKTPAAPVITPASCTFNEPLSVTITAESGATIYYTTDGSNPTDQSTQYTGPFTVSTTTTVKAKAYVNGVYGATATATYTYSNVQPGTGDFVLVTSADQLVAGNEYIIMSSYEDDWEDIYNVAFGSISSSSGTSLSSGFTVNGNIGESGSTVSLADGSDVNVLTLGGSTGSWNLKQSDDKYIVLPASDTKLSTNASPCSLVITIGNDNAANIQNSATTDTRQLRYYITSDYFRNYLTSQGKTEGVYLYTRATNSVQNPVFSPVPGIYNVDIDVTISCATDGATIYYTTDGTEPSATNGTEYTGEMVISESTTFKAIAVKGENSSSVVTAEYTIQKSTDIETVELTYSEPFTAGIGYFTIDNVSGFSPVWSLDGNYGVKGTSYSPTTNPTNNAAISRLVSPIIDMTGAVQPELTFSHQINNYFNDVTTQATLWIRETTDGTDGTWVQLPITFSDPAAAGGWTNDLVDIDLTAVNGVSYAGKKVQISFLYTNPTEGSGAGTWEIQNFVVADNSEYHMVNNIAEFLALENGTKAKFKNPVTVLYDYAQYSSNSYHEYIWVKDESGYMQFYLIPTLNSSTESNISAKAAYYENGDIIPAGFVVIKNYYENGQYVQAYSGEALEAGFLPATQKGLADPEYMDFDVLDELDATDANDVATWSNHYITLEKIKLTSSSKSFRFKNEAGTQNSCVGYNKYNGDGSLLKGGTKSADVTMPTDLTKFYNVKAILQPWQGDWEIMPIEFTEWKAEEVTLRKLCADGVEQNVYTISNPLQVVYVDTDNKSVWVKDDTGQSIWKTTPEDPNKENFAIDYADNTRSEQANYDQSNWCQLVFEDADDIPSSFASKPIINGSIITGKFTNKMNPTLEITNLGDDPIMTASSNYAPNYYVAANFSGPQLGYFFMNPKPQEYAHIVWAIYDETNNAMIMPSNTSQNPNEFTGSFKVNMSMNSTSIDLVDGTETGKGYEHFTAIIRLMSTTSGAPMLKGVPTGTEYVVFPLDITQDVPTAINDIFTGNGEVKSVKFYNVAGIESNVPFQGVNIVVTEYTDGSRTTTKMLKR